MSKYFMLQLLLCLTVSQSIQGKIRNGYEADIEEVYLALSNLRQVLEKYDLQVKTSQNRSYLKIQRVKSKIAWLTD